jgi:hypothetical protein
MYKVSAAGFFTTNPAVVVADDGETRIVSDKIIDATGGEVDTIEVEVGDVFIATGEENADGVIPTGSVKWTYIPSGDDTDSQYRFDTTGSNQVFLKNTTSNSNVGSLLFKEGTAIDISTPVTGEDATINIKHADVANTENSSDPDTETLDPTGAFTVVDGVTVNAQGHVTNVNYKKFTLPEDTTYDFTAIEQTNPDQVKL